MKDCPRKVRKGSHEEAGGTQARDAARHRGLRRHESRRHEVLDEARDLEDLVERRKHLRRDKHGRVEHVLERRDDESENRSLDDDFLHEEVLLFGRLGRGKSKADVGRCDREDFARHLGDIVANRRVLRSVAKGLELRLGEPRGLVEIRDVVFAKVPALVLGLFDEAANVRVDVL